MNDRQQNLRAKLLLLGISTLLCLYAAEGVVRFVARRDGPLPACRQAPDRALCSAALARGEAHDGRPFHERIAALRKDFGDVVPALGGRSYSPAESTGPQHLSPLAGISRVKTLLCTPAGSLLYDSDEHGFRNPLGLQGVEGLDLVLLGDSFAHGYCVAGSEEVGQRLRADWPQTLNLGFSDAGPLQALATFREYGAAGRPRHLVWLFFEGNDLGDLQRDRTKPPWPRYLEASFSQGLREKQEQIDSDIRASVLEQIEKSRKDGQRAAPAQVERRLFQKLFDFFAARHTRAALRRTFGRLRRPTPPPPDLGLLEEVMTAMHRDARASGSQLHFVYLPSFSRIAAGPLKAPHATIVALAKRVGMSVVDLVPTFEAHPDPKSLFPFRINGHYTAEGYGLVAEAIKSHLITSTR